jgi:hypothetical protein
MFDNGSAGSERTQWQSVTLPGGEDRKVYIEVVSRGVKEEVGLLESIPFDQIKDILSEIAVGIGDTLDKIKPKKASVELGISFGLETGKLVALIARGTTDVNLKLKLEWEHAK